ncbi:glycoside hydrolase family 97 protein [Paraflavitalea pollutisoli]|uniref:glycoside hydrolase family 97 protein n=1 Tax=Paraflavitalea pollutisoli TaxID=3034143 RepID=UPI0023EC1A52|nr:glycoside hydrolase family 97 protein [Paraflavitalea sp. H1-2-19X]
MRSLLFVLCCCTVLPVCAQSVVAGSEVTLQSPDKKLTLQCYQKQLAPSNKRLYYQLRFKDQLVIGESALDIQLDNHLSEQAMALKVDSHARWCENLVVKQIRTSTHDSDWTPPYGERSVIRDRYHAASIELVKDDNPIYPMTIEVRVYNEGAAIRYFFPENVKGTYYRVMQEHTEFVLPANTKAWYTGWAQGAYQLLPLAQWPDESERPLTLQLSNGLYACLAEARMVDYARTKFKAGAKPNTIVTSMYTPADLISPFATPWRVIMVAEQPGQLIENNDLLLNLNEPSRIPDMSWIKPGKIMRVMTQTTRDAKENIDFAARHGLQYILFDWKWYGPSFTFDSDATKVAIPDFDLPGIIAYGQEKGIGVWLYANLQGLYAQSDSLFAVYNRWGVKGVKFGFVQVGSHRWTTWLEEMFKKAAHNQLMVNVHDDWRPTGEQRTWPNLVTAEGIRGNEEMPDATHNTILPFTRYIAGAADYTICYYDPRIRTTHAHQLALAAVYYSPLQTLYWYDKPAMSQHEPELSFWDHIPTSWDETRVLQGRPGEYVSIARRKGEEWFVGTITSKEARKLQVSFDFLPKGQSFKATVYSDDPAVKTNTQVRVEEKVVTAATVWEVPLRASGGQAIRLQPIAVNP